MKRYFITMAAAAVLAFVAVRVYVPAQAAGITPVTAESASNGANITNIPSASLTGTIPEARLPGATTNFSIIAPAGTTNTFDFVNGNLASFTVGE